MLSLEQCRQILGKDCQLTDGDLERLREQLYALADIAIAEFTQNRSNADPVPADSTTATPAAVTTSDSHSKNKKREERRS